MASCLVVTAVLLVLITTVATIVCFAMPNWLHFVNKQDTLCNCASTNCDCGLWISCLGGPATSGILDNCKWFFSDNFQIEKDLPDWFKAVQGLMSCAVASSMLALLIGLLSLCNVCKGCNAHQAAGAFANLTFLLIAVSVCVFGAKAYLDHQAEVLTKESSTGMQLIYGWGFWVAVGAGVFSLLSSVIYYCVGHASRNYDEC
ncbi:unnamed protein product [Mytilus edulis]|uniref:Uncharacterized protein n=1 Tax=Mytilus edulis TaxID=6550 RepID=A0A8S3QMB7_MYTED|nr:unnamed protein product [Mytilus edulis]